MAERDRHHELKMTFERLGERAGDRVGRRLAGDRSRQARDMGKRIGGSLGNQLGRLGSAMEKETVSAPEMDGIGGKIGAGVGGMGKELLKARSGSSPWAEMSRSLDLSLEGRTMGAKVEKLTKRKAKSAIERLRRSVLHRKG